MSSDPPHHLAHHDSAHEPLDLDPVRTLPADEAPSPVWLPILGAVMALLVVTVWAVGRSPAEGDLGAGAPAAPTVRALGAADAAGARSSASPPAPPGAKRQVTREDIEKLRAYGTEVKKLRANSPEKEPQPATK